MVCLLKRRFNLKSTWCVCREAFLQKKDFPVHQFQWWFPLLEKKYWIRENGFHRTENASLWYGLEDLFKNRKIAFTRRSIWQMEKISSTSQKISKLVSTNRNWHLHLSKDSAKFWIKKKLFPLDRKSVFTSRNKEFLKKYVSTWQKIWFHSQEYMNNGKNCFY